MVMTVFLCHPVHLEFNKIFRIFSKYIRNIHTHTHTHVNTEASTFTNTDKQINESSKSRQRRRRDIWRLTGIHKYI